MKRDIKFRGKRIDNGDWVYGSYVDRHGRHAIITQDSSHMDFDFQIIPETIGQFTGKKDAEGNEVYEGDYCLDLDGNNVSYYAIFYCDKNCAFRLYYYSYAQIINEGGGEEYSNKLDVVDILDFNDFLWIATTIDGNIYDNPELLK